MRRLDVLLMVLCVGVLGGVAWGEDATPGITMEEAEAWGKAFEGVVRGGDVKAIEGMIDVAGFRRRLFEGLPIKDAEEGGLGLIDQSALSFASFFDLDERESFDLVRVRDVGGEYRVLYRAVTYKGDVSYYCVVLARGDGGEMRAVDVAENTVEPFSSIIVPMVLGKLAEDGALDPYRLNQEQRRWVEHFEIMQMMLNHREDGAYAKAYHAYGELPVVIRENQMLMRQAIYLVGQFDEVAYAALCKRYLELYREDPMTALVLESYLWEIGQYETYIEAVDRLDRYLGGDVWLDVLRGDGYLRTDEIQKAEFCFRRAGAVVPDQTRSYVGLMYVGRFREDYALIAEGMTEIKRILGGDFKDVREMPSLKEFVASEEGKKWLAEHQPAGAE